MQGNLWNHTVTIVSHCQTMHAFILSILFLTSIFLDAQASNENRSTLCPTHGMPSSHIQFPFHVRGWQQPTGGHPGEHIYALDYNPNDQSTTIHFPSYGDLVVKSISYDTQTLQLVDPKNCVHQVFLNLNLSLTPFQYYYALKDYSYLNCSSSLSPSFAEIPCLSGYGYHVYTLEDPSLVVGSNSCTLMKTVGIPFGYSPYLSDNSFGLKLSWGSAGGGGPESEQQTQCFTMAQAKVLCVAIIIFAVATVIRLNMHHFEKLQCRRKEGQDQIKAEKSLGEYKALKVDRWEVRQEYSV